MTKEEWRQKYELVEGYQRKFKELTNPDIARNKKDQKKVDDTIRNIMIVAEDTILSHSEIYTLYINGVIDPTTEAILRGSLTKKKSFFSAIDTLLKKMEKNINPM